MGFPLIISVAMELDAMAEPQPKVSEFYVGYNVVIYFKIYLHYIPAFGVAHFPNAVGVFDYSHIPRTHEVVHYLFAI